MKFILFLSLVLLVGGCTHSVHINHTSDIQGLYKGTEIHAESEQFVILGVTSETNYVNRAFTDLKNQCNRGTITGIQTRYSTSHGFLSWTNKINMTARCIKSKRKKS